MEHSHPLPDRPHSSRGQHSLPSIHASAVTSITTTPPRLNPQSRRLQLRNVGFRGPALPPRRTSPLFTAPQHTSESFSRPANRENSPISPDKRILYGEDIPPSPVNILQEIHNSKRRRRVSPRSGFGQIFEDNTATAPSDGVGNSWYNEASNNGSPTNPNMPPASIVKLREGSLNGKTPPPLSAPLVKQVKSRNENRPSPRSASSEAAKYIEHLEAQLSTANARLESVTSPNTGKARSSKVRALTAESRSLREEVSDWEKHFAERLKEETEQRFGVEAGLKSQLQILEDDSEVKDAKIRELECELEGVRDKVKEAEKLAAVNVDLERRIDVLTNLLGRSPTKLDLCSATPSPSKADPHKRTRRPTSMLPRPPCSPGGVRLSLSAVSESAFWHSRSFGSRSSISESPEDIDPATQEEDIVSPCSNNGSRHFSSIDLESSTSTFYRSARSPSSRPTSIQSASSLGTGTWGLPLPSDMEIPTKSINRQRRMRRFPSGSCSLKPLILPNATTTSSLPASAPTYLTFPTPSRNITDISLDPTIAFLSSHELSSRDSTPTPQVRQDSTSWAQEQALRSLEGRDKQPLPVSAALQPSDLEEQPIPLSASLLDARRARRSRPRSLEEELEQANLLNENSFEDGLIPVDLDKSVGLDVTSTGPDRSQSPTPLNDHHLRQRHTSVVSDTTPRPGPRLIPTISPSRKTTPSSNLISRNTFDIYSKLATLIARTKQDPLTLAQRLLYNAWTLGSARLGGIGWWLIGPLFYSFRGKGSRTADGAIVDGAPNKSKFDWHHYSARESRRRTAEHYLREHGGDYELLPQDDTSCLRQVSGSAHNGHGEEPQAFPCAKCIEPSSHRTLRLWWQFSIAIILAVGVAIKHGPGALLVEDSLLTPPLEHQSSPRILRGKHLKQDAASLGEAGRESQREAEEDRGGGWNGDFTFAEPLGPGDFEST